jgi:hypothetical protein
MRVASMRGAACWLGLPETWTRPAFLKEEPMPATKRVDGQDLPPSAFAFVGDTADPSTWLLALHFSGNRPKTKNHIRNSISRFAEIKGIPDEQSSAVWQCIVTAAKAHGIRMDYRQPKRAKETATGPRLVPYPYTPEIETEHSNAEALADLAAERFYERMTSELDEADEAQWRADTKQKLEELIAQ